MKLEVLSLFSGIGAFEKALTNIGMGFDVVGFSEIDKWAIKNYCALHNVDEALNMGDISKIDVSTVKDADIVFAGFPCTDISKNGLMKGFDSVDTSSGLVHFALRIIEAKRPKYVFMENVKNITSPRFMPQFKKMIELLESYGYAVQYKILNTKDFGLPHNRERAYLVAIREDVDNLFDFSNIKTRNMASLDDILSMDDDVDNITEVNKKKILCECFDENLSLLESLERGKASKKVVCLNSKNKKGLQPSQQYRVYSRYGIMTTISANLNGRYNVVSRDGRLRKLTPKECLLLQGFGLDDYVKISKSPEQRLYKQAGNTISVNVLMDIFRMVFGEADAKNGNFALM